MMRPLPSPFVYATVILIGFATIAFILHIRLEQTTSSSAQETASAAAPQAFASSSPRLVTIIGSAPTSTAASSTPQKPLKSAPVIAAAAQKKVAATPAASSSDQIQIQRIANPYPGAPESFGQINTIARAALVNILCTSRGGSFQSISGSGVIIDPRGVILTNAHVAQYVLLSEDPDFDLSCVIRTGSPASGEWVAHVLYMPPIWVQEHVQEINEDHPTGTGEHDYALLRIISSTTDTSAPGDGFPSLPVDTREAIGFLGDQILGASYPAEFIGAAAAQYDLYAVSSVSTIQQLLTFATSSVDVISLGGAIEAQSGSSGGAVVNAWGYLIGVITTTSGGATTAQRDLRAITLSYINTDMGIQSGSDLQSMLSGDLATEEASFESSTAPGLINQYIQVLTKQQ